VPYIENKQPNDMPMTVIQGQQDGTVDWKHNLTVIRKKFPRAEIVYLYQGHHQMVNETEE
jgi:alpha-beta hydrolase superfamily lysophospholipase